MQPYYYYNQNNSDILDKQKYFKLKKRKTSYSKKQGCF